MLRIISILKLILILFWSLLAIIIATVVYLFTWTPKVSIFVGKHFWSRVMMFLVGTRIKVHGKQNIQKGQPYLVISNHSSYTDIPTLFRALPIYPRFIGKNELRKVPFLGFYMRMAGMIFIDRSNPRKAKTTIGEAAELAKKGNSIVIFPEGTTIIGEEIASFKRGAAMLAFNCQLPILPVRIKGTHRAWPSDTNMKIRGGKIDVHIGQPIPYHSYKDKSDIEFLKEVREEIIKL